MFKTFVQALSCVAVTCLMFAAPNASAEPEEVLKQVALDYLQGGGNGKTQAQLEQELKDQAADVVIGLIDMGGASLGVPGAGQAVKTLMGLFQGGSAGQDETAKRLAALEGKVKDLALTVNKLKGEIAANKVAIAKTKNALRTEKLLQVMQRLKDQTQELAEVPSMNQAQRQGYMKRVMDTTRWFLPEKNPLTESNLWMWTNIRVSAKSAVGIDTPDVRDFDLALEAYLHSLALLVQARAHTGLAPDSEMNDLIHRHLVILAGDDYTPYLTDEEEEQFEENSLLDQYFVVTCSSTSSSTGSGTCGGTVTCRSSAAGASEEFDVPSQGSCQASAPPQAVFAALAEEVRNAPNPVTNLIHAAANALNGSSSSSATVPSFPKTPESDSEFLYAVDGSGRLFRFRHTITKVDLWAKGKPAKLGCFNPVTHKLVDCKVTELAEKVDCSKPSGRFSLECQGGSLGGDPPKPEALPADGSSLSRYEIKHEVSLELEVPREWGAFRAVLPSQRLNKNFAVYGLQLDGALIRRLITDDANGALLVQQAPAPIPENWKALKQVFSTGEGVVYGVDTNDELIWARHSNNLDISAAPSWQQRKVGRGWGGLHTIFSPGLGRIYVVHPDGKLMWYRHVSYLAGTGLEDPNAWDEPKQVGTGWNIFTRIAAGPGGVIYAINSAGELLFYRHTGWETGKEEWESPHPVTIATNWQGYRQIFTEVTQPNAVSTGPK